MQKKNRVVQFKDGWARVIICEDVSQYIGVPDTFVNPILTNVAGISPEFWEIRNGAICPMSDEDRVRRRSDMVRITSDLSTSEEARKWMCFVDGELENLKLDAEGLLDVCNQTQAALRTADTSHQQALKSYESLVAKCFARFGEVHGDMAIERRHISSLVRDVAVLREQVYHWKNVAIAVAALAFIAIGVVYGVK